MSVQDPKNKAENTDSNAGEAMPAETDDTPVTDEASPKEIGGRGGLDPTRYGDWEKAGRCIDF
jgi:hypothetical protein